jgi:hypothetical protein
MTARVKIEQPFYLDKRLTEKVAVYALRLRRTLALGIGVKFVK